jgi:polysaccharide biosynthesis transport protein
MNYHRLPAGPRSSLPAFIEPARGLEPSYRADGGPELEFRASQLRALLLKGLHLGLKYKLLLVCSCCLSLLIGMVVTFLTPKIYSAATTVKIDRVTPSILKNQPTYIESASSDPGFWQTQLELIKSRSLAERVATSLNLAQSDFVGAAPPSLWSRVRRLAGRESTQKLDPATLQARQAEAVAKVMGGISVQPVALGSSLVRIRYHGTDPAWVQRISIAVAEQFERSTLDRRFSASRHAREFLEERLQQLKVKLHDSEKHLVVYAQQRGIINADDKQPEAVANLQSIQGALASAVTERLKREQLWLIAHSANSIALPQAMSDRLIQAARDRIGSLQAIYQEKLSVLKPAFPEMVALRAQIAESEKQIRAQMELIKETIKAEYEAARAQELALIEKLEEVKGQVLESRGRSIEYTILRREADTARSLYDGLLQQYKELGIAGDVDTNNISIIDRAIRPGTPDSPSLRYNLTIAFALGLLGAAAFAGIREILDDTFKATEDVEEVLRLPVLGLAPSVASSKTDRSVFEEVSTDFTSAIAESYRSLRTALQFSTEEGVPRALLVTSARPGEGKSTAAACLACNFAQLGMRVLLIDGDLRNPSMHQVMDVENNAGLTNYLAGANEASELVKPSGTEGVTLLTSGPRPPNPAELLAGPRFATLLTTGAENFDLVIVDGPPIMGLADSPIIASVAGGTLLVIEAGVTRRAIVQDALKRLNFARARVLGVLLNKFDARKAGHTYGYGGYAYEYGGSSGTTDYYSYRKRDKALISQREAA